MQPGAGRVVVCRCVLTDGICQHLLGLLMSFITTQATYHLLVCVLLYLSYAVVMFFNEFNT